MKLKQEQEQVLYVHEELNVLCSGYNGYIDKVIFWVQAVSLYRFQFLANLGCRAFYSFSS